MATTLNVGGKLAHLVSRFFGIRALQPLYEHLNVFSLLSMNVGSATFPFEENGEINVMRMIRDHFNNARQVVIFDVGAHRGDYAEDLGRVFGDKANVYCFEPFKSHFTSLQTRFEKRPNFKPYQLGLSDKEEVANLYDDAHSIPTMVSEVFDVVGGQPSSVETIKTARLDQFCQDHLVERINFLKLDIEGYELKVLQGAREMIAKGNIDFIQFEFGPPSIASRSFIHDFHKLLAPNYNLYRILRHGLFPLGEYHPKHEIFLSVTNYLAIRKPLAP